MLIPKQQIKLEPVTNIDASMTPLKRAIEFNAIFLRWIDAAETEADLDKMELELDEVRKLRKKSIGIPEMIGELQVKTFRCNLRSRLQNRWTRDERWVVFSEECERYSKRYSRLARIAETTEDEVFRQSVQHLTLAKIQERMVSFDASFNHDETANQN